jgi:hypothetical protein
MVWFGFGIATVHGQGLGVNGNIFPVVLKHE